MDGREPKMDNPATSLTLLGKLRQVKDDDAWRRFVSLYGPMAYRLARRKGFSAEAADTVVERFLFRSLRALPAFEYDPARGRFRHWVLRVALNEVRAIKREESARKRAYERAEQEVTEGEAVHPNVLEWWDQTAAKRTLQLALERLRAESSEEQFGILYLSVVEGVSPAEVTRMYGKTAPQVSVTKFRMLARLRRIAQLILEEDDG